jgi:NADPH2 dehydrogenase
MSTMFQPIQLGKLQLQHRVVLAPMTRLRTTPGGAPKTDLVKEFYAQRANTPGTLLVTEETLISAKASGFPGAPGIWTDEQVDAWKEVSGLQLERKGLLTTSQIGYKGSSF